jgi:hypothetical protein
VIDKLDIDGVVLPPGPYRVHESLACVAIYAANGKVIGAVHNYGPSGKRNIGTMYALAKYLNAAPALLAEARAAARVRDAATALIAYFDRCGAPAYEHMEALRASLGGEDGKEGA